MPTLSDLLAVLAVAVSVAGLWWQMHRQWLLGSAMMITSLVDRYESESMRQDRRKFAQHVQRHLQFGDVDLPDHTPVLGFFENIGHLVRRGVIDKHMVWNKFDYEIVRWYAAVTQGSNLLVAGRVRFRDPALYEEFEWLYAQMDRLSQRRGVSSTEQTGLEALDRFIAAELAFE